MPDILLLQADQRAYAKLRGALEVRYRCRQIHDFTEIEVLLSQAGPRGCVLDVFHSGAPLHISTLRQFRRRHPSVALIAASDFTDREMELYHLGKEGVRGVVQLEKNPSAREVLTVVDAALSAALADVVVQSVARDLPPLGQEAIRWAIEQAEARPLVSDLSAALALSQHAFHRELRALNLAPPRSLLLWGRLIQATHRLEGPSETVENVAFRMGYATGGALRKALKRHVGCSPTVLLKRGGLAWTLEAFQQSCFRGTIAHQP